MKSAWFILDLKVRRLGTWQTSNLCVPGWNLISGPTIWFDQLKLYSWLNVVDAGPFHQPTYKSHQSLLSESESVGQSGPTYLRWPKDWSIEDMPAKMSRASCPMRAAEAAAVRASLTCFLAAVLSHESCITVSSFALLWQKPLHRLKSQLRRRQDKEGEPRQNERHETQNRTQLQSELGDVFSQCKPYWHRIKSPNWSKSSGRGSRFTTYTTYTSQHFLLLRKWSMRIL